MARVATALPRATVKRRIGGELTRWSLVLGLIVAWAALTRFGAFTPFMLPSPESVVQRIVRDAGTGDLAINAFLTFYRAIAGFLIAAVCGVAIGVGMTRSKALNWFLDPLISVAFPMPKVAFLPVIVLWLGFYDVSKIALVVFDTVFPVLTATIIGVRSVEKEILWSARSLGAGEREIWWQVVLPAALPQVLTGLQVALPIALIVATVAEMLMGGYGLGGAMIQASRMADSRGVFAGIVEIAVLGFVLVKLMTFIRRRALVWHAEAAA